MKACSAIKTDLFAADARWRSIAAPGYPLAEIELCIDVAALPTTTGRMIRQRFPLQDSAKWQGNSKAPIVD